MGKTNNMVLKKKRGQYRNERGNKKVPYDK